MNYLADEERGGCSVARARYVQQQRPAHQRTPDPHCHLTHGMDQVLALTELQKLLSDKLGAHVSLGAIGYFAQATGRETLRQLAQDTHIPLTHLRRHKQEVYHIIIPSLRVMAREVQRAHLGIEVHVRD